MVLAFSLWWIWAFKTVQIKAKDLEGDHLEHVR